MINIQNPVNQNSEPYYGDVRVMNFLERRIMNNDIQTIRRYCHTGRFYVDSIMDYIKTTILHSAVRYKKHDIVTLLLNVFHASTEIQDYNGQTAFYYACERGYFYLVKIFTAHQLVTSSFLDKPDNLGMTPLLIAYKKKHYPICKWLITKGAKFNHVALNGFRIGYADLEFQFRFEIIQNQNMLRRQIRFNTHIRYGDTIISSDNNMNITQTSLPRRINPTTSPINTSVSARVEKKKNDISYNHMINDHIEMLIQLNKCCDICLETYEKDKVVFLKKCGHFVCINCFANINKCHMCRTEF